MRLYWDQILVATVAPSASLEVSELSPSEARLRFRGYPAPYNPDGRQPSLYTYSEILPAELWGAHEGYYTRSRAQRSELLSFPKEEVSLAWRPRRSETQHE